MTEWREFKLGDVIVLNYGKALPEKKRVFGNIPVYSSAGLTGYHNESLVNGRGIIIGRKGTIGSVHFSYKPFWCIDTAYYITDNEEYNLKYIYYLLQTLGLNELNEDSAVPGLNRNTAYQQDISFPPLPEQKAIADVLSSLDDKIDLLTRQNKTLEDLAQAYFRKWFIEDIHNKICYKRFADVAEFSKGKKPREIIEEQRKGYVRQILIDTFDTDKEYYTRPEGMIISTETDILMVMDGASSGRVEIGFSGVVGSTIGMFRPKSDFKYPMFLYEFLKSNEEFIMDNTTGSAIPHADKKLIFELEIPYFQEEKIQEFENFALVLFNKRQNNRRQIRTLTKLRDTLLPKLISGEIRVKM